MPEFLVPPDLRGSVPPISEEACPILALIRAPHADLPPPPLLAVPEAAQPAGGLPPGPPALAASGGGLPAGDGVAALPPLSPVEPSFDEWLARLRRQAGVPPPLAAHHADGGCAAADTAGAADGQDGPAMRERLPAPGLFCLSPAEPEAAGLQDSAGGDGPRMQGSPLQAAATRDPRRDHAGAASAQQRAPPAQPSGQQSPHAQPPPEQPRAPASLPSRLAVGSEAYLRAAAERLESVQVTLLVPSRRALRGAFPLNGTYCARLPEAQKRVTSHLIPSLLSPCQSRQEQV